MNCVFCKFTQSYIKLKNWTPAGPNYQELYVNCYDIFFGVDSFQYIQLQVHG